MGNPSRPEELLQQLKELSLAYQKAYDRIPPEDTMHAVMLHFLPSKRMALGLSDTLSGVSKSGTGYELSPPKLCQDCGSIEIRTAEKLYVEVELVKAELKKLGVLDNDSDT